MESSVRESKKTTSPIGNPSLFLLLKSLNEPPTRPGASGSDTDESKPAEPKLKFPCDKCDLVFAKQSGLTNHKRTYHQLETVVIAGDRRITWKRSANGRFRCACGRQNWRRPVNFASHAKHCPSFLAYDPASGVANDGSRHLAEMTSPSQSHYPNIAALNPVNGAAPGCLTNGKVLTNEPHSSAAATVSPRLSSFPPMPTTFPLFSTAAPAPSSTANSSASLSNVPAVSTPVHSVSGTGAGTSTSADMSLAGPNVTAQAPVMKHSPPDSPASSFQKQTPYYSAPPPPGANSVHGTDGTADLYGATAAPDLKPPLGMYEHSTMVPGPIMPPGDPMPTAITLYPIARDTAAAVVSKKLHMRLATIRLVYCEDCRQLIHLNLALDHRRYTHQQNISPDIVRMYNDCLES
ncbi:transcription factor Rdp1 [Schizosaccharomyces japonicus yFS275]|uniref:Transcription factor Rdp1 n=1 Tax=Schizosaccharomyces japonicus (strain yFS275 / FY16936) TaxID=402676 RepID=B6JYC2_SCHJY|nr:transcription factor Rdp1 [Schizosaccharomyces japonicus yFS275]EEB06540.1 transcription factor Rdp1 [Schizosaccharomyces japonicus yFS275]